MSLGPVRRKNNVVGLVAWAAEAGRSARAAVGALT
jgi:hypothetical protein